MVVVFVALGLRLDICCHLEDLLETLTLVEALGEAEAGAGDTGERLAPAQERLQRDVAVVRGLHGR